MRSNGARTQIFAGFVIGAVILVLVAALLSAAVTTYQLAGDFKHATNQLEAIRKADAKAEQARVARSAVVTDQLTMLRRQNAEQARRDRLQRRYLAQMAKALRSHGIPVPSPPRATVTASPKAPRRHPSPTSPGSPTPTEPSPSTPTNPYCVLVPALCDGFPLGLPPLLP
jgi:hypothetical protein